MKVFKGVNPFSPFRYISRSSNEEENAMVDNWYANAVEHLKEQLELGEITEEEYDWELYRIEEIYEGE